MKTRMLFLLMLLTASAVNGQTSQLKVIVDGIEHGEGFIRMALYGSEDSFRDEDEAVTVRETVARTDGPVKFAVPALPPGRYAVLVHHDSNRNHNFDHALGLFAREGYGLSNSAAVVTDERFEDAAFDVAPSGVTEIHVQLRYCDSEFAEGKPASKIFSCWISLSE